MKKKFPRWKRERESHLLNPPPGSTDPERFATKSIGIGDRVCCFTLPPENPDTNGVRFRSEQRPASLRAVTCLGLFDGLSVRPLQATSFHHHTAVPTPKRLS